MGGAEDRNESFDCYSNYNNKQEPGEEATNASRTTNMDISDDLFFSDGLGNLERHDCDGKQANGFDDLQRRRVI